MAPACLVSGFGDRILLCDLHFAYAEQSDHILLRADGLRHISNLPLGGAIGDWRLRRQIQRA